MRTLKDIMPGASQPQDSQFHWMPDQSLPYVIHFPGIDKEKEARDPFVCIWPRVRHISIPYQEYDMLVYTLNREHLCKGRILKKSETNIIFEDIDGHFSH